jgi:MFS family permease
MSHNDPWSSIGRCSPILTVRLLQNRDFRLIFASLALSSFGDALALVALVIRVHDLTGSGFAVSALVLSDVLPFVVLAPLSGLLVDRLETVRVLSVTALIEAGTATGLAFAHDIPAIVGLAFLLGAGGAITTPGRNALIPAVVGEGRTTEANAYIELARFGGAAVGPAVAGALAATLGTKFALLVDAVTFVVVTVSTMALRIRRPPTPGSGEESRSRWRESVQGVAHLRRDAVLGLTILVLAASLVFAVMDNVALVFFAKGPLKAGDTGYGVLLAAWTVGMVTAAMTLARRLPPFALAPSVLAGSVATGVAIGLTATFPLFALALPLFVLG